MPDAYPIFLRRMHEIRDLAAASALMAWDQEIYLPPKGVPARARHRATLAALIHERICDPGLGELMATLDASDLDRVKRANLRETKRGRDRALKIPRTLVTALAEAGSLAQPAWVQAKQQSDWACFAPHLARIVDLKRQEAAAVGYEGEPYNALLDEYEPETRVEELDALFAELKSGLVPLIEKIVAGNQRTDASPLRQQFGVTDQDAFGREVLRDIGFDFEAGRLDRSTHPFTEGMAIGDVRITTKYDETDLGVGLYANLHEGGHALYEQGLPTEHEGAPVAAAVSLGIHESQSRLWENAVGRSREFWVCYLPRLQEIFPDQLGSATVEDLYRATNRVEPSLIRIKADEVTYNLHIVLRMELERALLHDEIQVSDLPALWREKVKSYFGLELPDDSHGPLQDIHWSFGAFGYFPTYTLGNLYAAQFYARAAADLSDLPDQIARGEFDQLLAWLRKHIHNKGSLLPAAALCRELTGEELSVQPFLDYLYRKYGEIYGL